MDDGMQDPDVVGEAALAAVFPDGLPTRTGPAGQQVLLRHFPLEEKHLLVLKAQTESGQKMGVTTAPIQTLKRSHHRLAMLLATGMRPEQAAMACGYHPSTVSVFQTDPMFRELLNLYADGVTAEFQDTVTAMADLADDVVMLIRNKLETHGEHMSLKDLNEVLKTLTDRSGNGPSASLTTRNLSVSLNGSDIERIKAGASGRPPHPADGARAFRQLGTLSQEDQRALDRVFADRGSPAVGPGGPSEGIPSGPGTGVRAQDPGDAGVPLFGDDAEDGAEAA